MSSNRYSRFSGALYTMPTASTSSRTCSLYKMNTKNTLLSSQRRVGLLSSNLPKYQSTYSTDSLNRPLPNLSLDTYIMRDKRSELTTSKPRLFSASSSSQLPSNKYFALKKTTSAGVPEYSSMEARNVRSHSTSRMYDSKSPSSSSNNNYLYTNDLVSDKLKETYGSRNKDSNILSSSGLKSTSIEPYVSDKLLHSGYDNHDVAHLSQSVRKVSLHDATSNCSGNSNNRIGNGSTASSDAETVENLLAGGKVGLRNLGNTCFMNSILQILSNTKTLLDFCLRGSYQADLNCRSSMNSCLMNAFADLIKHLWKDASCVSPSSFQSQIQKYAPRFSNYQQQDAQEFLRYLLEGLHSDVNRVKSRRKRYTPHNDEEDDRMSDSEKAREYWRRYLQRDDSKIVEIFVGQLRSELKFSCGHHSVTFDPFWDLSVSIPRVANDISIIDCIAQFMREEELDDAETPVKLYRITCSKCKVKRTCRKGFSIQKFPHILVLHLKRFSQEMFRRKLNTLVDFPVNLELKQFAADQGSSSTRYQLYGICNHSGGTHSGHYTSYCRHPFSRKWHFYNDSRVSATHERELVSSEAYVLFYELLTH